MFAYFPDLYSKSQPAIQRLHQYPENDSCTTSQTPECNAPPMNTDISASEPAAQDPCRSSSHACERERKLDGKNARDGRAA
jgi:hypothetical protein